ncbi:hypothetical protein MCC93_09430 [Morococcus cerebrosus]|uniref:Uncharacterized protein n=1 Tax=Morococcus cerebrosus TaxID=1056807 RepID=A0A0C1EK34_9NEIS|nr:hypothetical protein MCC93_09430 [Morococcus cerebrosus]
MEHVSDDLLVGLTLCRRKRRRGKTHCPLSMPMPQRRSFTAVVRKRRAKSDASGSKVV